MKQFFLLLFISCFNISCQSNEKPVFENSNPKPDNKGIKTKQKIHEAKSNKCTMLFDTLSFEEYLKYFKIISLPLDSFKMDSISLINKCDSLNAKLTNYLFIKKPPKYKAQYLDSNGSLKRCEEYGLYPDEVSINYSSKEINDKLTKIKESVTPRLTAIGRLELSNQFITLIIKSEHYEGITYDLWNLSKDGKTLSMISLYWAKLLGDYKTVNNSSISKDGTIKWSMHTYSYDDDKMIFIYRTYKLNQDGYFEVLEERKVLEDK